MCDVTYLRTVKRCKYETLYTLSPTEGVSRVSVSEVLPASCHQDIDGGSKDFSNISKLLPHYMTEQFRRQSSS
jgi:hypothetical protein